MRGEALVVAASTHPADSLHVRLSLDEVQTELQRSAGNMGFGDPWSYLVSAGDEVRRAIWASFREANVTATRVALRQFGVVNNATQTYSGQAEWNPSGSSCAK